MGKTTIGRIIALSQIVCGWEAIECRSPTDVLKMYRQDRRQVFVADDFFRRTEYEPMRVSEWQSELAHILPLLGRAHWLILTCRAHLLEMAMADEFWPFGGTPGKPDYTVFNEGALRKWDWVFDYAALRGMNIELRDLTLADGRRDFFSPRLPTS